MGQAPAPITDLRSLREVRDVLRRDRSGLIRAISLDVAVESVGTLRASLPQEFRLEVIAIAEGRATVRIDRQRRDTR